MKFKEIHTRKEVPQMLLIKRSKISFNLRVFYIKDGEFEVAYMPALNLSGYGKKLEDAKAMLKDALEDFFDHLIKLEYPFQELSKYGWKHGKLSDKRYENSAYIDKEGVLRNLKMPTDTPIQEAILEAA